MSWHIRPNGDPGRCSAAEGACPYGGKHFTDSAEARKAFENAASFNEAEFTEEQKRIHFLGLDTVVEMNDSGQKLHIGELELPYMDALNQKNNSLGRSDAIADYFYEWYREPWAVEDELTPYGKISHSPIGNLVGLHHANTFTQNGETWVVDFGFGEIDPNAPWPYTASVENWGKAVDKASVLGVPAQEPEPIDPRTLSLALVKPGDHNPLLERAVLEEGIPQLDKTTVKFLSIDQVKVACVKYKLNEAGEPALHSIETREEYRHQGYMKKLLQELSNLHGNKKIRSSGSMTNDGYEYTRHLTSSKVGELHEVKWDFGLNGKEKFSFVGDWITGYAR